MRSNLVAASKEKLSPGVSSSPQVKLPRRPPGREKWQSPMSREVSSTHSSIHTSPVRAEAGKASNQRGGGERDPERGGQG